MQCLLSARYVLKADILRQSGTGSTVDISDEGYWKKQQDPLTGAFIRKWVPLSDTANDIDVVSINCWVNGIIDGGIRVAGTTERFERDYKSIDYARMFFGTDIVLTQRDRVTNIRNAQTGQIIWLDEQLDKVDGAFKATVFDVEGITPIINPFGRHIENYASLKRSDSG